MPKIASEIILIVNLRFKKRLGYQAIAELDGK